ncbi:MAG: MbnH family di-heme enzyme [Thiotrichales bacterium]
MSFREKARRWCGLDTEHSLETLARACAGVLFGCAALAGCGGGSSEPTENITPVSADDYVWNLPPGFPPPRIAPENPISEAKVELGRFLFYDRRMSVNETTSCATCHLPAMAFTDGLVTSVGALGEQHPRNALSLTNVVYNASQNWANPATITLHQQALVPLFNEFPVELGWSDREEEILDRFRRDAHYPKRFADAYPGEGVAISIPNVVKAVSSFVATMISGDARYDQANRPGATVTISESARRGEALFFSERLECFHCHGGFNFSNAVDHSGVVFTQIEFHNNGLYNVDGQGAYPLGDRGLWDVTARDEDMGKFKAPTLRNIALTAPYMHDGSIATLDAVIDHYARGGRLIESGPNAGDGALNPHKSELLVGFELSPQERLDLVAFFESLTDWTFLCDKRFSDPFGEHAPHSACAVRE